MKLGLSKMVNILERLGFPERKFPSIHIAGTNGKGSTAAMVATILREAGYKIGLYTSPHLIDFRERIQINGEMIPEGTCRSLVDELENVERLGALLAAPAERLSFFEFVTMIAFLHFARSAVDLAVIESGLGGRLDATNVITPLVSVITNIGLDHTAHLGETLEAIAFEKGGIIKPGVPVVCGAEEEGVLAVIREQAKKNGSAMVECRGSPRGGASPWAPPDTISLAGRHQQKNAATAVATIEVLRSQGWSIPDRVIGDGLRNVVWPGRLEQIGGFLLDGAHNPPAMRVLKEYLGEAYAGRSIRLVIGLMADKDVDGILQEILPVVEVVTTTRPAMKRALNPSVLAEKVAGYGKQVRVTQSVSEALEKIDVGAPLGAPYLVVITGSLFVVGEARSILKSIRGVDRLSVPSIR